MGIMIFIDLSAAYDTIPRILMFRILTLRLGLPHFVALIKSIYTNTTATIKGSKKRFKVGRGCRQGGLESPFIFNIVFDTVCRVLHHKLIEACGDDYGLDFDYSIPTEATNRAQRYRHRVRDRTKLYRVQYADDCCCCFRTLAAAKIGLEIIESEFKRYGLTLSRPKTESMTLNFDETTTNSESIMSLGADNIKNVLEFKYLGVMLCPDKPNRLIEHRVA